MARRVKIASAQYPIEEITTFLEFQTKISLWVQQAAAEGAELLVFPEYAALELARIGGAPFDAKKCSLLPACTAGINDFLLNQKLFAVATLFVTNRFSAIKMRVPAEGNSLAYFFGGFGI